MKNKNPGLSISDDWTSKLLSRLLASQQIN